MRRHPSWKDLQRITRHGRYSCGHGCYMQIAEGGTRAWVFRYRRGHKGYHIGLGSCEYVTLAEAREKAIEYRRMIAAGRDPLTEKHAKKREGLLAAVHAKTFRECATAYIAAHESGWRGDHSRKQWVQSLEKHVFPKIGSLAVADVDLPCVLNVIEPIWTTVPETARRVRNRIELVLDWATARGIRQGDNPARWKGRLENLLPQKKPNGVEHLAAMKYADVPAFMARLRQERDFAARALEFQILTAVRPGQACGARWAEIKDGVWTLPPERTKNGREHRIPLSREAEQLLASLPRIDDGEYVFPAARGDAMKVRSLLRLLRQMGIANDVSHGFRSAFSDWAHERTSYAPHVIEQALGHVVGTAVERSYRRTDLLEQRRRLMQQWSEYCSRPHVAGDVVPLRA
jgi:integrase